MARHIGPDHVRCLSASRNDAVRSVGDLKRLKWVLIRFDSSRALKSHLFLLVSVISSSFGKLTWIWLEQLRVLSHGCMLVSALPTVCILLARWSVDLRARLIIITQVVTVYHRASMQDLNLVIW